MRPMILLTSRLPGGRSMSAGRRPEKLGYQQSTLQYTVTHSGILIHCS